MRFYTSIFLFFFILYTQNLSAAISDFNSLIKGKKESIIANPQGLQNTLHSFSLEKEKVIAAFSELEKTLVLDNFPIGKTQLSTVELTISPSSVDSRTKVFVGNQQIPLPFVSSFIGSIPNEPGSSVLLTTSQGHIYCWIMRSSGEQFVVTPSHTLSLDNEHHILSQNEFILIAVTDFYNWTDLWSGDQCYDGAFCNWMKFRMTSSTAGANDATRWAPSNFQIRIGDGSGTDTISSTSNLTMTQIKKYPI